MARTTAALSALAFLLLGSGVVGDEPGVLIALVGAALCVMRCSRALATTGHGGASTVVVPGRRVRLFAETVRQHHPDAAGRPRPRAPGRIAPAL